MEEEAHGIVIVGSGICGLATALALHRNELRCLKRKDLIETMAKNLPSGAIRYGCHVVAIHQDTGTHGAILTTVDGCIIKAKVLIGCDGANSVVAKYLGLSAPITNHHTVFRGFTRYPHGHPFSTEFLRIRGEEFFVGRIPVTDNLVHFLIVTPIPPTGRITYDVIAAKDSVIEKLQAQDCPSDIIEMLRNSDPETLNVVNNIWYRPPWQVAFGTFHKGIVTVAGDAMHVVGPFIGQGGASGLEDAIVLARSLSRAAAGDYSVAIKEYVRERRLRVSLVSLESFVFGMLGSAKSRVTMLVCIVVLALLGNRSLRHADFDCGRL
ncbi:hypothetical protein SORBI_3004G180700 [Sorghum bicolor]|uniref:FAD-binding domain-containing protein n=1 Tax=Sorghum bicolor TaxID=4558 RepID=A0A1Z5RNI0_SORBI|nr:hypothetical protein SORBI_3004G180700 [Sorghum bicolor]